MNKLHWLPQGRTRFAASHTCCLFLRSCISKNLPVHHPPPPPHPQLFSISFVSIETGSCPMHSSLVAASFPAGSASARVSPLPSEQQQDRPQSDGNFLTAQIYLSKPGSGGMQLCIDVLYMYMSLLLTERAYLLCESIWVSLCMIVAAVMWWLTLRISCDHRIDRLLIDIQDVAAPSRTFDAV